MQVNHWAVAFGVSKLDKSMPQPKRSGDKRVRRSSAQVMKILAFIKPLISKTKDNVEIIKKIRKTDLLDMEDGRYTPDTTISNFIVQAKHHYGLWHDHKYKEVEIIRMTNRGCTVSEIVKALNTTRPYVYHTKHRFKTGQMKLESYKKTFENIG